MSDVSSNLSGPDTSGHWVAVAHLLRPQGRRGELLADPLTDLAEIFTAGRDVWLAPANASVPAVNTAPRNLEEHFFPTGKNAGRIVLKLSGCDTISAAEQLAGQHLLVPASALPTLDADTFFVSDLLGCALYDGENLAGNITDVQFPTAPDGRTRLEDAAPLLAIETPATGPDNAAAADTEPILIPFIRAWLVSVDIAQKRITMHLPAGLLSNTDE